MFTISGLAFHLFWLLLVAAVLMQRVDRLRLAMAAAAAVALAHALMDAGNPAAAAWPALLLAAALMLIGRRLHDNRRARFSAEEEAMLAGLLAGLPRSRARHFLDQGMWLSGQEGDALAREGEPISHLYYLAAGDARVISHGRQVGLCRAGDLIGEITALSSEPASAAVILNGPARFWCAPAASLRAYLAAHEDVHQALEHGFASSLRAKLRQSNRAIAEAGGMGG